MNKYFLHNSYINGNRYTFACIMLYDLDYMLIQYADELRLLRTQWKAGHSMQDFKQGLLRILEIAEQQAVTRVVLDLHDLPDIDIMEQAWISLTWLPKMASQPLQQVALVMPPRSLYNQMVVESILWMAQALIHFDIQFFSEAEDALEWVTGDSPLLPASQQEWHRPSTLAAATSDKHYVSVTCS
ncbi:hypothetical protein H8B15_05075 [Hymenobacter sp. BT507]|uniref:STAS/SEC14 domain-containing protein n=1 Tax=Hymenobacter citatus TaxID=2763506 RepID=A0ABR7MGS1_9BACT|nr:STAS/SEC14 domain-containing protein [Hymenobacter citatus]MBC6610279.1 hypothetical protein [Hymenobacter citatus]